MVNSNTISYIRSQRNVNYIYALPVSKDDNVLCIGRELSAFEFEISKLVNRVSFSSEISESLVRSGDYNCLIVEDLNHVELDKLLSYTVENQRVIIVFDNRFGLAFFDGYTANDGKRFPGIQNTLRDECKLFSLTEMKRTLEDADMVCDEVLYPYPSYRDAKQIYTDYWLPDVGELTSNEMRVEWMRLRFFDEDLAYNNIVEAGDYRLFSNSYIVCASKG